MKLSDFGLTEAQRAERRTRLGGSEAKTIMTGTPEEQIALWREKRGEISDDLGGFSLPMLMGQVTEPLNIAWFAHETGREVESMGKQLRHEHYPFMGVTLDGLTTTAAGQPAVLQCKHVNEFSKKDDVVARYVPQLTHEMVVAGRSYAVLSVLQGTMKWWHAEVEMDPLYAAKLVQREREFWACVESGEAPAIMESVQASATQIVEYRTVDMTEGNVAPLWAELALKYLEEQPFIWRRDETAVAIRELIADDVGTAMGNGLVVTRRVDGALVINTPDLIKPTKPRKSAKKKETV